MWWSTWKAFHFRLLGWPPFLEGTDEGGVGNEPPTDDQLEIPPSSDADVESTNSYRNVSELLSALEQLTGSVRIKVCNLHNDIGGCRTPDLRCNEVEHRLIKNNDYYLTPKEFKSGNYEVFVAVLGMVSWSKISTDLSEISFVISTNAFCKHPMGWTCIYGSADSDRLITFLEEFCEAPAANRNLKRARIEGYLLSPQDLGSPTVFAQSASKVMLEYPTLKDFTVWTKNELNLEIAEMWGSAIHRNQTCKF